MIVSNSTPLINFASIGRLDIMETLFAELTIPPAVKPLLDAMRQEGRFWVNPRLYTRILTEQGE